jgi:hypothetical protein
MGSSQNCSHGRAADGEAVRKQRKTVAAAYRSGQSGGEEADKWCGVPFL